MDSEAHAVHRGTTSDCERTRIEDKMDPNRYACTVLEEARAALARLNLLTLSFSKRHLATLLEELQTIVNRMEAGLEDKSDYSYARDRLRETRAKLNDLKAEKAELKAEIKALKVVVEQSKDTGESQGPNSTVHDDEDSSLKEVLQ
jgi:uncharacterized FAD-dependent dehydrogenase